MGKFTIRRLTPEEPGKPDNQPEKQVPGRQPEQQPSVEKEMPVEKITWTGGLFSTGSEVLAFLSRVFSCFGVPDVIVRQAPEKRLWAEIGLKPEQLSQWIWALGGKPYTRSGETGWLPLLPWGEPEPIPKGGKPITPQNWGVLSLASLFAQSFLPPARYQPSPILHVMVPGPLSRLVLTRAAALGLKVEIASALCYPLDKKRAQARGISVIRLTSMHKQGVPGALVHILTKLPYLVVCAASGEGERILVDIRSRLPIPLQAANRMIPDEETWLLGPPETGHWCLKEITAFTAAELFLHPSVTIPQPPSYAAVDLQPLTLPVKLTVQPGKRRRLDAVLIDDNEITWLRDFLTGSPLSEEIFILPGPEHHLVTSPGGFLMQIPFGIPLTRIGPGALYIQANCEFYPPLPDAACVQLFNLDSETVVVILQQSAYRFSVKNLLPIWCLWAGSVPEIREGISESGTRLLQRISQLIKDETLRKAEPYTIQPLDAPRKRRIALLEKAMQADLSGNPAEAAALLEQAGFPGQAGRLYERAGRM